MKSKINFVMEPSDILTVEMNDIMGGGCEKVKNKCKPGEVEVMVQRSTDNGVEETTGSLSITAW